MAVSGLRISHTWYTALGEHDLTARSWAVVVTVFVASTGTASAVAAIAPPLPIEPPTGKVPPLPVPPVPTVTAPPTVPSTPVPLPPVVAPVPVPAAPAPAPAAAPPPTHAPAPSATRAAGESGRGDTGRAASPGRSAAGGSSLPGGSVARGRGASAGGADTPGADRVPGRAGRQDEAHVRRERRLRRTIRELRPCLPLLSRLATRVLVLRAGVGDREPHSRAAVARRVERPVRVVRRLERRGISRLRALMRAGSCSVTGAIAPDGAGAGGTALASSGGGAQVDLAEVSRGSEGTAPRDAGAVKSERSESAGDRSGSSGPIAGLLSRSSDATDLTVPALVLLVGLALLVGWRAQRGRSV